MSEIELRAEVSIGQYEGLPILNFNKDVRAFMSEVDSLCGRGGPSVRQSIIDVCKMFHRGLKIFPVRLLPFIREVQFYDLDYTVSFLSLSRVLKHVQCCYVDDQELVVDYRVPLRMCCDVLRASEVVNISVATESGIKSIYGGSGELLLDYIVPKYNGLPIRSCIVTTNISTLRNQRYFVMIGSDIFEVEYDIPVFSGELVGENIYLHYGCDLAYTRQLTQVILPDICRSGNEKTFYFKSVDAVSIDTFLSAPTMLYTDGYIMCINGCEYKIKSYVSVDLKVISDTQVELDGKSRMTVSGIPKSVRGICEFYLRDGSLFFVRERLDKLRGQSSGDLRRLRECATYPYVRTLFMQFRGLNPVPYTNFYATEYLKYKLYCLIKQEKNMRNVITKPYLRALLANMRIHVNSSVLSELYAAFGGIGLATVLNNGIPTIKKYEDYSLSCAQIYEEMRTHNISGNYMEVAREVSLMTCKSVSSHRVFLMACRGELGSLDATVFVRTCANKTLDYVCNVIPREVVVVAADTCCDVLANYAKYNDGAHILDDELQHFKLECAELQEWGLCASALEEVGDVLMMWSKVLLRMLNRKDVLLDGMSTVWTVLLNSSIMAPFVEKMRMRMVLFDCVRNHFTCGSHRCPSGFEFKKNADIKVFGLFYVASGDSEDIVEFEGLARYLVERKIRPLDMKEFSRLRLEYSSRNSDVKLVPGVVLRSDDFINSLSYPPIAAKWESYGSVSTVKNID